MPIDSQDVPRAPDQANPRGADIVIAWAQEFPSASDVTNNGAADQARP